MLVSAWDQTTPLLPLLTNVSWPPARAVLALMTGGVYYRDTGQLDLCLNICSQRKQWTWWPPGLLSHHNYHIITGTISQPPQPHTNITGMLSPHAWDWAQHQNTRSWTKNPALQVTSQHESQQIWDKKFQTKSRSIAGLSFTKDKHYTANSRPDSPVKWLLIVPVQVSSPPFFQTIPQFCRQSKTNLRRMQEGFIGEEGRQCDLQCTDTCSSIIRMEYIKCVSWPSSLQIKNLHQFLMSCLAGPDWPTVGPHIQVDGARGENWELVEEVISGVRSGGRSMNWLFSLCVFLSVR